MAIIHEATREVILKIVYHGAGMCGKTTSLLHLALATAYAVVYSACVLSLAAAAFESRDFK